MKTIVILALLQLLISTARAEAAFGLLERMKDSAKLTPEQHEKVIIEAGEAIGHLPRRMDGTWKSKELETVIKFLRAEPDSVYRQQMIENDAIYIKDNRAALVKSLKQVPKAEAKDILLDVDAIIDESERGNDDRASAE